MTHIFVTGGTGFLGRALLRHWQERETGQLTVTILTRDPDGFRAQHSDLLTDLDIRLVRGDVTVPESLPRTGAFTHILHAATVTTLGARMTPLTRFDHSVQGTRNVLDLAVRLDIRRVLYVSSGGAYGPAASGMDRIPEDYDAIPSPLQPQNAYSMAKRAGEHLCALYAGEHGLHPVIARCFAFVGRDLPLDAHYALGNFVQDVLANRPIVVQGDGTPVRSYLDQRDLAAWLMAMIHNGARLRAYNVGSDEAIGIGDLARLIGQIGRATEEPRILGAVPDAVQRVRQHYVPDIERARSELGLNVTIGLEQAITQMLVALRTRGRSAVPA